MRRADDLKGLHLRPTCGEAAMRDSTRRHLGNAVLLLATLGAAGLMISPVLDIQARTALQAASLIACVGSAAVWVILVHRRRPGHDR